MQETREHQAAEPMSPPQMSHEEKKVGYVSSDSLQDDPERFNYFKCHSACYLCHIVVSYDPSLIMH